MPGLESPHRAAARSAVRVGGTRRGPVPEARARRHVFAALALAAACLALPAHESAARADEAHATPVVRAGPCDAPECRQFDFWVGDWDVLTADGKLAGTNHVERILGGCVIAENWSGARGTSGKSFNIYSPADSMWHQTWVDDQGTLLVLAGGFHDGRMVLEGRSPGSSGGSVRNRITWEKLPDGRVSQRWEVSSDEGLTWVDAFLGFYGPPAKPTTGGKKR